MNNALSNLGYTTYYSGSPEDIVNCESIYLVNKIPGINISNLNLKLLEVLQNPESFSIPNYLPEEDCFFLDTTEGNCIDSFNTIIYLNVEGPIGYTVFYDDLKCDDSCYKNFRSLVKGNGVRAKNLGGHLYGG